MRIVTTFAAAREGRGRVGLVPTMGYLHEGHLSLVRAARRDCDTVVVSLFVNPLQFGPGEDLDRYPRDLDRDAGLAAVSGADILFAPETTVMYPEPPRTRVVVSGLTDRMEGAHRPGHFVGVATVVAKLFAGIRPDRAYFGRKDAQQLAVVRRLARDLSFPLEVVGAPTVREADGVALSSRNTYLDPRERQAARALSRGLMAAADAVEEGERDGSVLESLAWKAMEAEPLVRPEYAELASQEEVSRLDRLDRPAFLAVAARVGETRLIDNVHVDLHEGRLVPDRGVRLTGTSVLYREE